MKKVLCLLPVVALTMSIFQKNNVNAHELDRLINVSDYINKDYRKYSGMTIYGQPFKKNIFGTRDRQVIKFGKIELDCQEIVPITDNYFVGDNKSLTINSGTNYSLTNEITSSKQTTLGVKYSIESGVKLEDINLSNNIELTNQYQIYKSYRYTDALQKSEEVITEKDLNKLCDDKTTYRVSKIAINLKFNIEHSYLEEDFWGKWWEQSNNINIVDYEISYHLFDIVTFVYNDNTFGNKIVGNYHLTTIKEY